MTARPVRCSAWLGVRLDSGNSWSKSLETLALGGDDRTTGDRNVELRNRMQSGKTKSPALSRRVAGRNAKAWLRLRRD